MADDVVRPKAHYGSRDAARCNRRSIRAGWTDRRGNRRDAAFGLLVGHAPAARSCLVERRSKRFDRLNGAWAEAPRRRKAFLARNAHRLLEWQRRQPCLAVRSDGKWHSANHLRLIDQAGAASLNASDPA